MPAEQQHDWCMKATQRACERLPENGRAIFEIVPVSIYGSMYAVTLYVDYDPLPFKAWASVYNDTTSKTYKDLHGTDDPLILYANLRHGLRENLLSIAWKADKPRRSAVLDFLSSTALGDLTQE